MNTAHAIHLQELPERVRNNMNRQDVINEWKAFHALTGLRAFVVSRQQAQRGSTHSSTISWLPTVPIDELPAGDQTRGIDDDMG